MACLMLEKYKEMKDPGNLKWIVLADQLLVIDSYRQVVWSLRLGIKLQFIQLVFHLPSAVFLISQKIMAAVCSMWFNSRRLKAVWEWSVLEAKNETHFWFLPLSYKV